MKYDLYFNHLRNVAYVFKFNKEFRKVYDLYFRYLPVYEIFIRSLRDVEIKRQADKIKPASFLFSLINVLKLENKNVNQIMMEILEKYTIEQDLIKLLNQQHCEIINNTKNFLKNVEKIKERGIILSDNLVSPNREISNVQNFVNLQSPIDTEISAFNTTKNIETTTSSIHKINQHGFEIDKNNENFESLTQSIKGVEIIKKGHVAQDEQTIFERDILSILNPKLEYFHREISKQTKIRREIDQYRNEIIHTHFITKILETYYREALKNIPISLEIHGNELNNLYKSQFYDTIYDLLYFINHVDVEYTANTIKRFSLQTYSVLESEIKIIDTISTNVDIDLIEIKDEHYYQIDFKKKGKVIQHDFNVNLISEVFCQNPNDIIISDNDIFHKNFHKKTEILNKNILIYPSKKINNPNEEMIIKSYKDIDIENINITGIKHPLLDSFGIENLIKPIVYVEMIDQEIHYSQMLNWIDSIYETCQHKPTTVQSLKKHGYITEDKLININREISKFSLEDIELMNINIILEDKKNINTTPNEIITIPSKIVNNSLNESINTNTFNIYVEKMKKQFDEYEQNLIFTHKQEATISFLEYTNYSDSESIIKTISGIDTGDNDIIKHQIIFNEKENKIFDDFKNNNLNIPSVEIIVNHLNSSEKNNKMFDEFRDLSLSIPNIEIIIENQFVIEKAVKILNEFNNYDILIVNNEFYNNLPIFLERYKSEFDDYINRNMNRNNVNILIEFPISAEQADKIFDELLDNHYSFDNNQEIIIINGSKLEIDSHEFNEYEDDYYNITSMDIYVQSSSEIENLYKQFNDFKEKYISSDNLTINIDKILSTEKVSNQLNIIEIDNHDITKQEIEKYDFLIIESKNKEFIISLDNSLDLNNKDIIKHFENQIEKNNKQFDINDIDFQNINIIDLNLSLKKETEIINKQLSNIDSNFMNSNLIEVDIIKLPHLNEIISKMFNNFENFNLDLDNMNAGIIKQVLLIKKEKELTYEEIENIILNNVEILFPNIPILEESRKLFDDFDINNLNLATIDLLYNELKFSEKSDKILDVINDDNVEKESLNIYIEEIKSLEKLNKIWDDFNVNFINLKNIDINNNQILSIEHIEKTFEDYNFNIINTQKVDIDNHEVIIVEKNDRNLDSINETYQSIETFDIVTKPSEWIEKNKKDFDDNDIDVISSVSTDVIMPTINWIEKHQKEFDDFIITYNNLNNLDIKIFDLNSLEKLNKTLDTIDFNNFYIVSTNISNRRLEFLEKMKKIFDEYDSNNINIDNLNIDLKQFTLLEKINKTFEEYDFIAIDDDNININDWQVGRIEKDKRILDSIDENYQSLKVSEIINQSINWSEKSSKEFNNFDIGSLSSPSINVSILTSDWLEKFSKEFNNFNSEYISSNVIEYNLIKQHWLEKIRKIFDDFHNKEIYSIQQEIDTNLSDLLEKFRKEFHNYGDDFLSSGNINAIIHDLQDNLEKTKKEFENYEENYGGRGVIEIDEHNPVPPDGWVGKKEKELEEYNDQYIHKAVIEIAYNMPDGEQNSHHNLDEVLLEIAKNSHYNSNEAPSEIIKNSYRNLDETLLEIIKNNSKSENSYNTVEEIFIEIVTDSHRKFFDQFFTETLNALHHNHAETFKTELIKNSCKEIELSENETKRHKFMFIETVMTEVINKLIKYRNSLEIKQWEIQIPKMKAINYSQKDTIIKSPQFITKMQLLIEPLHLKGVVKKGYETWKSFKDAIINNKQILQYKNRYVEELEIKNEIIDMVDEVLNWITLRKREIVIHQLYNLEEDIYKDEIDDFNSIDFINTNKLEIASYRHKGYEEYDKDEIEELNEINFTSFDKLEINLHKIKEQVENSLNDEIEEIDTIVHVNRNKIEALTYLQKKVNKSNLDIHSKSPQIGTELQSREEYIHKFNGLEQKQIIEANSNHLKKLELDRHEVLHKNPHPGVETGKRGFDYRLLDWWSQDWVFLTERKTPMGEMIQIREEAIADFKNFMQRCILYQNPIKGEVLDDLVFRWSVNTDYDPNYVNEIEHFYYLVHTKVGKNHDYTEGQLNIITDVIIRNYKEFYVDKFKEYHFNLADPHEEVRIRLRAMLHFYMFLEQLIDANEGYLSICTVQEGIDFIKKILRGWIESETSYFEPTEEELEQLDPWIAKRIKENLPKDYVYLVRWFEWYCKEEEFIYGHNFTKNGLTAVSNVRDKMISYFNTHWGIRRTNYMDILDKLQVEVELARATFIDGTDPEGVDLTIAMNKIKNFEKPKILIDTTVVDKIRGMMHGKLNRINRKFNIAGTGTIQRSSLMGWKGINKHDKNQPFTWTNQEGKRYGNLKDSYNIDQHSLEINPNYNTMIYNIVKVEKIEE